MAAANSCLCIISRRFWPRQLIKTAAINISGKHFSTSCWFANQKLQPHGQNVESLNQKWRLVTAICVERLPVITQPVAELESRVQELYNRIEDETSVISDYEIELNQRHKAALNRLKAIESDVNAKDKEVLARKEVEGELAELEEEAKLFQPASRTTQADEEDDRKSLDRKLAESLFLLVKKARSQHAWQMPQGRHEGEESLRETAERELGEECGQQLKVKFLSNAPCALYSYKFHPDYRSDEVGAKVFFYKTFHNEGQVILNTNELEDYAWVTGEEIQDYVTPEYYQFLTKFLYLSKRDK